MGRAGQTCLSLLSCFLRVCPCLSPFLSRGGGKQVNEELQHDSGTPHGFAEDAGRGRDSGHACFVSMRFSYILSLPGYPKSPVYLAGISIACDRDRAAADPVLRVAASASSSWVPF